MSNYARMLTPKMIVGLIFGWIFHSLTVRWGPGTSREDRKVIQVRKGSEVMGGGYSLLHKKLPSN